MAQITYQQAARHVLRLLEDDEVVSRLGFRVDYDLPGLVGEYLGNVMVRVIVPEASLPDTISSSATMHWLGKLWCQGDEEWERVESFLVNQTSEGKWGCTFHSLYSLLGEADKQGNHKPWLWERQEYENLGSRLRLEHEVDVSVHKSLALPRHYWMEVRYKDAMIRIRGLSKDGSCQIGLLAGGHVSDLPGLIGFLKKNPQQLEQLSNLPPMEIDDSALRELAAQ